jgi:hypothetical protein
LTAQEDGRDEEDDPALLDRAAALNRVVFTNDRDFSVECGLRQQSGKFFFGLVYADQGKLPIGKMIDDLELIAKVYDPIDIANRVDFLPL